MTIFPAWTGGTVTNAEYFIRLSAAQAVSTLHTNRLLADRQALIANQTIAQANAFTFKFSSNTTVANPGSGLFRFNNANPASATRLVIHRDDIDGLDVSDFIILALQGAGTPLATVEMKAGDFRFRANVTAFTDNTSWLQLTITNRTVIGGLVEGVDAAIAMHSRAPLAPLGDNLSHGVIFQDDTDPSKGIRLRASLLSTGQTRDIIM